MEGIDALDQGTAVQQTVEQEITEEFFRFFAESEMMDIVFEDVSEE